jgi:beta-phosphoglucomutase
MKYKAAIFDLDGVLVDTARYHYWAWKKLSSQLGFSFTLKENEFLKGVSRMDSLEILLDLGGMDGKFNREEKEKLAAKKNAYYLEKISMMTSSELLDGALETLQKFKRHNIKIALGSASKNAPLILKKTGIDPYFDVIVDGNSISRAKPDPEVFMCCAKMIGASYKRCVVFEDSQAGLIAAKKINMFAVGIGKRENLSAADVVYPSLKNFLIYDKTCVTEGT